MKITKKLEAEIKALMNDYWDSYFRGDLKHWRKYLVDDYRNIGGTEEEVWNSKKEILEYTKRTIKQMIGQAEIRNKKTQIIPYDPYIMVHEFMDLFIKVEGKWTFYGKFRLSSLIQKISSEWKVLHQHGSYPDSHTEQGEAFAFDKLRKENTQLREAVKRRTVELENKNRELEIETALEKVRAVAMGMKQPKDMIEVCRNISKQLQVLKIQNIRNVQTAIINDKKGTYLNYEYFTQYKTTSVLEVVTKLHPKVQEFVNTIKKSADAFFTTSFKGAALKKWREYRKKTGQNADPILDKAKSLHYYFYSIGPGALGLSTYAPLTDEEINIFNRFRNVFNLAYQRFIDIQKAEAQAREARIETALERVRAVAMAMKRSEDMVTVSEVMYNELISLGFSNIRNAQIAIENEEKQSFISYVHSEYEMRAIREAPYSSSALLLNAKKELGKSGAFYEAEYTGKELEEWRRWKKTTGANLDKRDRTAVSLRWYLYSIGSGHMGISTFDTITPDQLEIVKRFKNVFELSYTRFDDLQKAEAQAREAQIEAALEKVRSCSLAMHTSSELGKVVTVVLNNLHDLGFVTENGAAAHLIIFSEGSRDFVQWSADPFLDFPVRSRIPFTNTPILSDFFDAKEKGLNFFTKRYMFKQKNAFFAYAFENSDLKHLPDELKQLILKSETYTHWMAIEENSAITVNSMTGNQLSEDQIDILKRFARVFEQAYTRFLDLQKAEAQAREAKIEAALERTRTQSMLMQHSEELKDVSKVFHQQLLDLNIETEFSYLWLPDEPNGKHLFWATWAQEENDKTIYFSKAINYDFDKTEPATATCFSDWESGVPVHVYTLGPAETVTYFETWKELLSGAKKLKAEFFPRGIYYAEAFMKYGCFGIMIDRKITGEEQEILRRFTVEFERTYTRFLDLQKAEAQAREAQIEVALEKVRSRTMAMRSSPELNQTAELLYSELTKLGIEKFTCGFVLVDAKTNIGNCYMATPEGSFVFEPFRISQTGNPVFRSIYQSWKNGETFHVIELSGQDNIDHNRYLAEESDKFPLTTAQLLSILPPATVSNTFNFNHGYLIVVSLVRFTPAQYELMTRFTKVFEQTYTRFLDLQKAEAQAREAQIEVAVERVRAKALAMQSSTQISEVVATLRNEMLGLKIPGIAAATIYLQNEGDFIRMWDLTSAIEMEDGFHLTLDVKFRLSETDPGLFIRKVWNSNEKYFVVKQEAEDMAITLKWLRQHSAADADNAEQFFKTNPWQYVLHPTVQLAYGKMSVDLLDNPPPAEMESIMLKMGSAFDLAYKRFLDLQKKEAQAREAQIEAALERVRSRTMGMQKSEEPKEVIQVVYEQFVHLNIHVEHTGFIMDYKARDDMHIWLADKHAVPFQVTIPYFDCAHWNSFNEAKEKELDFFANQLSFEEKNKFYQDLFKLVPGVPEETLEYYFGCPGLAISTVLLENVGLYIENFSGTPYTDEENNVLMRFGKVFQQTYTRFLDLQKAEAQAREAQIEAALERVRSRTMAMHKSDELVEVIQVVFEQLQHLSFNIDTASFSLNYKDHPFNVWMAAPNQPYPALIEIPPADISIMNRIKLVIAEGHDFFAQTFNYEEKNQWLLHVFEHTIIKHAPAERKKFMLDAAGISISIVLLKQTSLIIGNYAAIPYTDDENVILKRFANVFEQTYTRFLDLQNAEAQARESQIQLALERVRARTMAMHHSDELTEVVKMLYQEFDKLKISNESTDIEIGLIDEETGIASIWAHFYLSDGTISTFKFPLTHFDEIMDEYKQWKNTPVEKRNELFITTEFSGKRWEQFMNLADELPELAEIFRPLIEAKITKWVTHNAYFSHGLLTLQGTEAYSPETQEIQKRFAKVFEQTYTRFLDLQKAEAQTHKSKIETALERVRARALAMQQPEELKEVAEVLRHEMGLLGVEELETCSIYINDVQAEKAECWYALKDIRSSEKKLVNDHFALDLNDTWVGREMLQFYNSAAKQISIVMQGPNRIEWIHYCEKNSPPFRGYYGEVIPDRTYHLYKFSHGAIGAASAGDISTESWDLLQRAASVFSLAYSRFKDLTQARIDLQRLKEEKQRAEDALSELQVTQKQLIQSEKMASLGELTAGIAHEIQNPLNFVNNFSEVSNELLDEMMQEVAKGNYDEVKAIADDVKQNLEKINHHGKRADGIVKGMLQHSRSSSGVKEPTDVNALADEYLRLAYHGLRAKDKSFNATMKTDFDESIGNINIIPQDIGRVILNLITNAFYVVDEKKKQQPPSPKGVNEQPYTYEPTVTVTTKRLGSPSGDGGRIEIRVEDNGNGIPQKILDKIFQPFFTTKPTGQGTGLGLSLSYDIVKAHSGELKVETKEGEGTTFIIQIPA